MHKTQRLINHVALVLDGSSSMGSHKQNLIRVADEQIKHLALRSEELSQETRVSVYLFDYDVKCLIFDMDVMRLPSIADLYRASGMTALVDSVVKSQQDLATTSQIYGDHAFLTFVLTDGMENQSTNSWTVLPEYTANSKENWTVGFLVPNTEGRAYLTRAGVDLGAIALWDATSAQGINDSFSTIRSATDTFMTQRASGVRGTRSVFSTGRDAVNKKTVTRNLAPMDRSAYKVHNVNTTSTVKQAYESQTGIHYIPSSGKAFYQLVKTETIQAAKALVVVDKSNGQAYTGAEARHIVGLPDGRSARVRPDDNPKYDIFVQSTSVNRKLGAGTKVLITK